MKKTSLGIILGVLIFTCFVFISNFQTVKAQSNEPQEKTLIVQENIDDIQLYVYPIKISSQYQVGGNVEGSFNISNIGNIDAPDTYYTVSVGNEDGSSVYGETTKKTLLYIKANSKRDVSFNYVLPTTVFGDTYLIIRVYLRDDTIIAEGSQKIYIQGEPQFKTVIPANVLVLNNNEPYIKDYGLVLEGEDKLSVSFSLSNVDQGKVFIDVYANSVDSNAVKKLSTDLIKDKNGKYLVQIPTAGLLPGKYIAKISFDNSSFYIQPISLEYTIYGLKSVIESINSDKLSLSKNDKFNLSINYKGNGSTEDDDVKAKMSGATITVVVKNENDVEIANSSSLIDLSQYKGDIVIPLVSREKAEFLYVKAEIKDGSGKVLDTYSNDLPSKKEVDQLYPNNSRYVLLYLVLEILALIILIAIMVWIRRFNFSKKTKSLSVIAFMLLSILVYSNAGAWGSGFSRSSDRGGVYIENISSPLPGSIRSYAPGETFYAKFTVDGDVFSSRTSGEFYYLLPETDKWFLPQTSLMSSTTDGMTLSNSSRVSASTTVYTAPNTLGVYNFVFYIAQRSSRGGTVIKKITQPILVTNPWTELAGTTVLPTAGIAAPNSCDDTYIEGQRECDNGYSGVWSCVPTVGDCSVNSVSVKGGVIVSTGKAGLTSSVIPSGVSVNIKNEMPGIVVGSKFYVVTDLLDSSWVEKQYAYTEFTYGVRGSKTYQPYTRKTNVHIVSYDGVNTVKTTSAYNGHDTKFSTARVVVKEVGVIDSLTSCRNIPASEISKMFYSPNNLGSLPLCTSANYTLFSNGIHTTGMFTTAAGGNNSHGRPSSMSVNVCTKSPDVNNLSITEPFYVLVDSIGTNWITTRYDIFNFNKGVAKDQVFSAPSRKYNIISGSYDGACTVSFVSTFAGHESDYTRSSIDVIEIGPMNSSLCYFDGVNYPANFNRGVAVPNIPKCVTTNITTCADDSKWVLKPTPREESCTDFLSCVFKNLSGVNINTVEIGQNFNFSVNYATSGSVSSYSYLWDFGTDASPATSDLSSGTVNYTTPGQKIANLKVLLNGVVVEQEQCSAMNVTCLSGNCPATCGTSVVGNDLGLDDTSSNLCISGQSLVPSSFAISSANIWSWKCKNNINEQASCSAKCGYGLNYCADTKKCSRVCSDGDMCVNIAGVQKDDDPIYTLLGCDDIKLDLSVKFNKPYASETTSKCSVNWSVDVKPDGIPDSYTKCTLDGKPVENNPVGERLVSVGQHKFVCETRVDGKDAGAFVTSGVKTKNFKCSRVPVSMER